MKDDTTLLQSYARSRSESDFAELVRRHVNLVYSCALRQVNGDVHLARDVAQLVFIDLARKANALANQRVLAGWLFTSTRFAASKLVRGEERRRRRELEAESMQAITRSDSTASLNWEQVRPVLDDALAELNERDREAILLRYLEGRDFTQVGAKLSLSDNAARMRVDRAIDKLRALLARRGVTSSAAALSFALSSQAVIAAPVELVTTITGAALATSSVTAATLTFMSLTKLQIAIAAAVVVTGSGAYLVQQKTNDALRAELAAGRTSRPDLVQLQDKNRQLIKAAGEADALRVNDAELERLRKEAAAVRVRMDAAASESGTSPAPASRLIEDPRALKELNRGPMLIHPATPVYPVKMAAAGIAGGVTVQMVIDAKGNVVSAKVLNSSRPEFDEAAIMAVVQWKFDPGQENGRKVNVRATQLIKFDPKDGVSMPSPDWF
ncbi:MAG TPA: TonB family protein [Lacunisphaera sp.]|jgi:RNA polymerase sigma factor (sigma-70 family)